MSRVLFLIPHGMPLFRPEDKGNIGGSEVRGWLFTRGLARWSEFEPHVITAEGEGAGLVEGVHLHPCNLNPSVSPRKWRRRLVQSMKRRLNWGADPLWKRLKEIDAHVLCTFGAHDLSATVMDFAQHVRRPALLLAGAESDFSPENRPDHDHINPYGYSTRRCWQSVDKATHVLVQNQNQAALLAKRFHKTGIEIHNPIDLSNRPPPPATRSGRKHILWIGNDHTIKGPQHCISLAQAMPGVPFLMVMTHSGGEVAQLASLPSNVTLLPRIPFAQAEQLFKEALLFVNTSQAEGFPNTFLQAGKYGVPIATLMADPDRWVAKGGCGVSAAGDFSRLQGGIRQLLDDETAWLQAAHQAYAAVQPNEWRQQVEQLAQIIRAAIRG